MSIESEPKQNYNKICVFEAPHYLALYWKDSLNSILRLTDC